MVITWICNHLQLPRFPGYIQFKQPKESFKYAIALYLTQNFYTAVYSATVLNSRSKSQYAVARLEGSDLVDETSNHRLWLGFYWV
ncbi:MULTISPECIES: hypothetical protein [Cyanophyceae]|uniref:hypothetical protein n=1 Tax=Cyanophyceae TaxID=3028117 RepID=UPI001686AC36|nr:hypothetical protein [Trichocoleus sp. FACHB-69]MBD1931389.1 hypothetical protein [Trichocoleus sp. FACHB-69]